MAARTVRSPNLMKAMTGGPGKNPRANSQCYRSPTGSALLASTGSASLSASVAACQWRLCRGRLRLEGEVPAGAALEE